MKMLILQNLRLRETCGELTPPSAATGALAGAGMSWLNFWAKGSNRSQGIWLLGEGCFVRVAGS